MTKFIVVDQTLRNLLGHHFEYSISAAQAAQRRGFEAIVLSNREFDPNLLADSNIRIVPHFRHAWFDSQRRKARNVAGVPVEEGSLTDSGRPHTAPDAPGHGSSAGSTPKGQKGRIPRHLMELAKIPARPIKRWILAGIGMWKFHVQKEMLGTFGLDLRSGLEAIGASSADIAFVHTLRIEEFADIVTLFKQERTANLPHFHVLFRRDFDELFVRQPRGPGLPALLRQCTKLKIFPERMTLYTDTDALTAQHNALSSARFKTAPIPFRHELIHPSAPNAHDGIKVLYLGDARQEKGFQFLPAAVQALQSSAASSQQIHFLLHTIVTRANRMEMQPVVDALAKYREPYVRLIRRELSPSEYYDLLSIADVVLIPYVASEYRRRSSGVLTEALAAGKPVVVPSGTWMASQVGNDRGTTFKSPDDLPEAIRMLVNDIERYRAAAEAYVGQWRHKHSPEQLVDCLLLGH